MEPFEKVADDNYFRDVLGNLYAQAGHDRGGASVRFGRMGDGVTPHYQVQTDKLTRRFSGQNHKPYRESPELPFDEQHLSPGSFSASELQAMIASRTPVKPPKA